MAEGPERDPADRLPHPAVSLPAPRLWVVEEHTTPSLDPVEDLASYLDPLDGRPGRFHTDVRASAARHPAGGAGVAGLPAELVDEPRLAIVRLALSGDIAGQIATVTLCLDGADYVGTAGGAADESTVHRTVARATARAVCAALDDVRRLEIGDVVIAALGDDRVAVVEVRWVDTGGSERLTGVSAVPDDIHRAVIRATLDAVNRRLSPELAR